MNPPLKKRGKRLYFTLVIFLPILLMLLLIDVMCVVILMRWQSVEEKRMQAFFLQIFTLTAAMHVFIFHLWSVAGKNAKSRFALDGENLVCLNPKGEQRFPISSITKIAFSRRFWLEYWMKIKAEKQTLLVTVFQEGIPLFLLDFKKAFERQGIEMPADSGLFRRFYNRALRYERADMRFREILSIILSLYIGLPLLFYAINLVLGLRAISLIFWTCSGYFSVLLAIFGAEKILTRDINRLLEKEPFSIPPRDREWEHSLYINTLFWCVLIFIGASVVGIVINILKR